MNRRLITMQQGCVLLMAFTWLFLSADLSADAFTLKVDEIGYHPDAPKYAILEDIPKGHKLKLVIYDPDYKHRVPFKTGKVLYKIEKLKRFVDNQMQGPGSERWLVDFSEFKQAGEFLLQIEDTEVSVPIRISEYLYWDTMVPALRSFYHQRSGQDVIDKRLGIMRTASHPDDALVVNSDSGEVFHKDVAGGWYNGGNYAKFVTSTGVSLGEMLAVHEMDPKNMRYMKLAYPVEEPGLGDVPDFLHEMKCGLDWLLTMQRNDGAFYRKVSGKSFPGNVLPEDDMQKRYIFGVTSQDTAIATAALASASRNFRRSDFGYAVKCLMAAERGWLYLDQHPEVVMDVQLDDDSGSREYINTSGDKNYRFWAAVELYLATGKKPYEEYVRAHYKDIVVEPYSWKNPCILGMVNYVMYGKQNKDKQLADYFRRQVVKSADILVDRIKRNSYHVSLVQYTRGSNQQILEHTSILLSAYRMTKWEKYREAASREVHYFFGMNPMGVTYVTGVSKSSVKQPYHRLVQATHKVIPGMLVAGPNNFPTDGKTPKGMQAMSYVDDPLAFSVNETQIMYNASLFHVLGMLNAAYNSSQ